MRFSKSTACALALAAAAALVATAPTGCGTSLKSIYISADRFPSAYAEALCTSLQHCCAENTVRFDYNACTAGWNSLIRTRVVADNSALANYDAKAASDCIAQVRDAKTTSCAPEPGSISAARDRCQQIYSGKKPPGAACNSNAECAPVDGQVVSCSPLPPGSDGGGQLPLAQPFSEPVCVASPVPPQGAPCKVTPPHGCEGGMNLFCDPASLTCLPQQDVAGPCLASVPSSCLPTAYCVSSGPSAGLCAAVGSQGAPCASSVECDTSTLCDPGTKTCVDKKISPAACADGSECKSGLCDPVAKICLKNVIATTNACTGVGP